MAAGNQLGSVEHIVVLVLENRSFDHMLGYLYAASGNVSPLTQQPFEGLTGQESNVGAGGVPVPVVAMTAATPNVYTMPGADPGEGYVATNLQLFGQSTQPTPAQPTNGGFVTNFAATLTGIDAGRTIVPGTAADDIMSMFTPALLPVLSGLARGFAVCDHWFCSVPTETFPNRAFLGAATSLGHLDDATSVYATQSIYGLLTAHGINWSIYGYDSPPLTRLNFPDTTSAPDSHFGLFTDFQAAAAAGTLAPYTFLEPSWGSSGNSQHPNYDVALGERLINDVYAAVRTGPGWDQTLLIVTYDEHGGCFDHVAPPGGATPPDNSTGEFGFDFTRFGVRVPTVLISPLIAPGTVFRTPGPVPFDHTSILKTVETRWQLPALTARDAAAPDIGGALTLTEPRTDDPLATVIVPTSTSANPAAGQPSHIQEVYGQMAAALPVGHGGAAPGGPPVGGSEKDYDDYIRSRVAAWTAARPAQ
jgi:phospholipase C